MRAPCDFDAVMLPERGAVGSSETHLDGLSADAGTCAGSEDRAWSGQGEGVTEPPGLQQTGWTTL